MQTALNPEYKTGIFKRELKNRFLCEVEIDGESTVCRAFQGDSFE